MNAFAALVLALVKRFALAIAIDGLVAAARRLGPSRAGQIRRKPETATACGAQLSTGSQRRGPSTTDEGA